MTSQEVIAEIKSLRNDLSTFNDHMVRMRYEDLKGAFLEQMRMAVGEEGKKTFQSDAEALHGSSGCELKAACLQKLSEAVDSAATSFMRDDLSAARRRLDEVEGLLKGDCSPCQDDSCSQTAAETIRRVRAVLQVYEGLSERLVPGAVTATAGPATAFTPEDAEAVLDPLANAWRIKVLTALRRGDHSLTELGRAVELRTGHLQFHLKALIGAGFVALDRRKHLYSITERGSLALACTEDMVARLGVGATSQSGRDNALRGDEVDDAR